MMNNKLHDKYHLAVEPGAFQALSLSSICATFF
jgi:hypothetical protein